MIDYVIVFILSGIVLIWAGNRTVIALSKLSRILKWKEFIVASLIMAIGSSLPELFVAIIAGIDKKPQISLGNVLGSNIIALTLLMGIAVLMIKKIKIEKRAIKKSTLLSVIYIVLPIFLMLDGNLSRVDGIILFSSFIFYLRQLSFHQKKYEKIFNHFNKNPGEKIKIFFKELGVFLGSLILLLLSSEGVIFSAIEISSISHLSLVIISILGVALGTSLPEIVFTIQSIKMGHEEMLLGDALGSVMVNTGLVLGTTVLICPLEIQSFSPYVFPMFFSLIGALLFFLFTRSKDEISRKEGFVLLTIYLLFFIIEIFTEIR